MKMTLSFLIALAILFSCLLMLKKNADESNRREELNKRYWYHSYEQGRLADSFNNNLRNDAKRDSFFILSDYNNQKRDSVLKAIHQLK
jgi:hypothetical protein